jgi:hypothetical protein
MSAILELVGKLGISGGIGLLIGLLFVWWVEPTTNGGTAVLILIPTILCIVIGSVSSTILDGRRKRRGKQKDRASEGNDEFGIRG